MTKKDIAFLKKLISLNRFEKIYSDDLSMRLLGNVSFYFSEMPFDFTLSREQAVDKKYNDLIKFYQDKNNNFAQRYVDEYIYNEQFYKEKFAEQYDRLSKEILVNELPDEEGVLIILANPKKKRFLHSSVIMKEEIKKTDETYQQEKILEKLDMENAKNVKVCDMEYFEKLVKAIEETKKFNSVKNVSVAMYLLLKNKEE